jgi:pyridinium-3,5-biscarboxylic acid mononucleotide sulfurtransferase
MHSTRNTTISNDLHAREAHLAKILAGLGSVAVAYSGGTDSAFLLAVSLEVLGSEAVLAVTADSPLMPRAELDQARALAAHLGARHLVLAHNELAREAVAANPPDRCYHCKHGRFTHLWQVARAEGLAHLIHGENADDAHDYRPGSRAAQELVVRAPLLEAGLSKTDIRSLSRWRQLPTWNRPADACLATRFPYGTLLTAEGLARVEAGEAALRTILGRGAPLQVRLRDQFPLARLEVPVAEIPGLCAPEVRVAAVDALRALGYRSIVLDLEGYRMGSMNDELE